MSGEHLKLEAVRDALSLPTKDRIEFIRTDRWLGYRAATDILTELQDLIEHPRNLRMPCRAIIGDANNGKTMLLERCKHVNPPRADDEDDVFVPVLAFQTPSKPSEARLYSEILKALRVAHREDARPERLFGMVVDRLYSLGVRLLLADEFHAMLLGGPKDQRQFLGSLKKLLNTVRIPFAVAGTHEVVRALAADSQFVTRFERLALPRWGRNQETRRLLASFEQILPLPEPSNLAGQEMATPIIQAGGGTIGGIAAIVKRSAELAVTAGQVRVTREIIDKVVAELRNRAVTA